MTQEEVASVMLYCKERGITYKARLSELGIPEWRFYSSKGRYARAQSGDVAGEFIQLTGGGPLVPTPSFSGRNTPQRKTRKQVNPLREMSVELRTPTGTLIHIRGEMSESDLTAIIQASSGHV